MVRSPRSGREQAVGAQRDRLGTDRLTVGRGVLCSMSRRPRAGRPGRSPPCRPAPGASSAAWSVCCSMARAGTVAAGAGGVTGAAGAAAAWGALFTAQTRCSRRREAGSIFFVSNFFKEQFGVSLNSPQAQVSVRTPEAQASRSWGGR